MQTLEIIRNVVQVFEKTELVFLIYISSIPVELLQTNSRLLDLHRMKDTYSIGATINSKRKYGKKKNSATMARVHTQQLPLIILDYCVSFFCPWQQRSSLNNKM